MQDDTLKTPGPRYLQRGRWLRGAVLLLGLVWFGLGLLWLFRPVLWEIQGAWYDLGLMGTPFYAGGDRSGYLAGALCYLGLFLIMQWFFLLPRGSWRLRCTLDARPARRAAVAAGFASMLLSAGFVATVLEVPGWWGSIAGWERGEPALNLWLIWPAMGIMWVFWALVFWRYWRAMDQQTAIRRTVQALLAGTVLQLLVAGPVQAWATSERDCYCARGSYTGLVFGLTVGLWLFGPGLWLLFRREYARCQRENLREGA